MCSIFIVFCLLVSWTLFAIAETSVNTNRVRRYEEGGNSNVACPVTVDVSGNACATGFGNISRISHDSATIKYFQVLRGDVIGDVVTKVGDAVYLMNSLTKEVQHHPAYFKLLAYS